MKRDQLLDHAIFEANAFLLECENYKKRINKKYRTCGVDAYDYYDNAPIERGTLKARSLLLIRKLQAWRKAGKVTDK